ncbi:MAG: hypothetical protein SGI88_18375 [Candidatus Hydrogenedentes bacterium]|nr:hypothetical protein [Candidatus Hydrogenedentota bacterium]
MKWEKKGVVFAPERNYDWMMSHASLPVADCISEDRIRIYFGCRDENGKSHTSYLEVAADNPGEVLYVHDRPVLQWGSPGTFDDSGIMPSWILNHGGRKYLYYIGWNPQVTVSYRLSIGLAVSDDGGKTFEKYSIGPICDRAIDEPFFNTAPCVIKESDHWRMWYISCTGWETIDGHAEPHYHVKYAESEDGIYWVKTGKVCIDYDSFAGAIGRPCVFKDAGLYKMIYSYRSVKDYRTKREQSYRLGYAESKNGTDWVRKDSEVGIERSENGWDADMMQYCHYYKRGDGAYLFYNGNGFGKTGFGYAVLT